MGSGESRPGPPQPCDQGAPTSGLTQPSARSPKPDLAALRAPDRVSVIEQHGLQGPEASDALDRVCRLARERLGLSAASLTVVGEVATTVASEALDPAVRARALPLEESFAALTVAAAEPLVVADADTHPWVCSTQLVRDGLVRSYLGVPLWSRDGVGLGALCAVRSQPHDWSLWELEALADLAPVAIADLELQLTEQELATAVEAASDLRRRVDAASARDPLTGLAGRATFVDVLRDWRSAGEVTVALFDLRGLAQINELFGHTVGDAVLQRTARKLGELAPSEARIARISGDQFAAALPGADPHTAESLGAVMMDVVAASVGVDTDAIARVGVNVGVATSRAIDAADDRGVAVLQAAETALRAVAHTPGSAVRVYDADLDSRVERRRRVERALRWAIHDAERGRGAGVEALHFAYQPSFDLVSGHVVGVEALARFDHPDLGSVSPGEFVPLAEEQGLVHALGRVLFDRLREQRARWHRDGIRVPRLWVNLSAREFDDPSAPRRIAAAVREPGPPLGVEITETALLDLDRALTHMTALRDAGVPVAIDDVGVGYFPLAGLRDLPAQALKIDRSFVAQVHRRTLDAAIVEAVLSVSAHLDADVVAEGIETTEQLETLRAMGCRVGSGYLLAAPSPDGPALRSTIAGAHPLLVHGPSSDPRRQLPRDRDDT